MSELLTIQDESGPDIGRKRSVNSACVEPVTVVLVWPFNVGREAALEVPQRTVHVVGFAMLGAGHGVANRLQHLAVVGPMLLKSWKPVAFEQPLFAVKVQTGELYKAAQMLVHLPPVGALGKLGAEFVERVHQDAMLIIHCLYAYHAGVIPSQSTHVRLPLTTSFFIGIGGWTMTLLGVTL